MGGGHQGKGWFGYTRRGRKDKEDSSGKGMNKERGMSQGKDCRKERQNYFLGILPPWNGRPLV